MTQILNFGLPSPIDVQVSGPQRDKTYAVARKLEAEMRAVRGAVDVRMFQVVDAPRLHFAVDRERAGAVGLTQRDVANNMLLTISSSSQVSPSFWIDPKTNNSYPVTVRVPETRIDSLEDITTLGITSPGGMQLFGRPGPDRAHAHARVRHPRRHPAHVQRAGRRAGRRSRQRGRPDRARWPTSTGRSCRPARASTCAGQVESMRTGFASLALGLLFAAVLVYCLMVVNFQSWTDPFIIITALPGALVGMVLALFATQTTFNVPSLMGAIMSVGVATANSHPGGHLRQRAAAGGAWTPGGRRWRPGGCGCGRC